jgi:hypothetical protein
MTEQTQESYAAVLTGQSILVEGGKTAAYGEALLVVERNAESCSGGENHIGLLLTAEAFVHSDPVDTKVRME